MTRSFLDLKEGWKLAAEDVLTVLDEGKDAALLLWEIVCSIALMLSIGCSVELEPDLAVETIPGITSFSAAAALFNRALACGQESLAVVPATRGVEFLKMSWAVLKMWFC